MNKYKIKILNKVQDNYKIMTKIKHKMQYDK